MTGPDEAVMPCVPPAPDASALFPSSFWDSSLSGWVRGAVGQRLTFAGSGSITYCLWCTRKPATKSVPYSQAMWACQDSRSLFPEASPLPGASTSLLGFG
jgi:hypothetical protein